MKRLIIRNAVIPARSRENIYDIFILDGKVEEIKEKKSKPNTRTDGKKSHYYKSPHSKPPEHKSYTFKSSNPEQETRTGGAGKVMPELDANRRYIVPGYIDLHIQGAGGFDVLDGNEEGIEKISKTCAEYGVTSFLATTVYRVSGSNYHLKLTSKLTSNELPGAKLLGLHLEGPFISINKRGMIQEGSISDPSEKILDELIESTDTTLKMMTIAPELPGSEQIIKKLLDNAVVPSFGHSEATYEEAKRGFERGIFHVTHLFNAMSGLHHRKPGPLIAIYENKNLTCQIIADGVHIHPSVLSFTVDIITPQRLAIITDGMRSMGLPDGEYLYEGKRYISKNGTARYKDGTLVGTTLGFCDLLNRFVHFTALDFIDVLKMGTEVPARVLGIKDYTISLKEGMKADLLILDEGFTPAVTIVGGRIVYRKENDLY